MNSNPKTIKMIGNLRFEVSLLEMDNGNYYVSFQTLYDGEIGFIGPEADYRLAESMFETKLMELEGM